MKKYFSIMALAAVAVLGFTACSDDDDAPQFEPVTISEGVFVINTGNKSNGIDGSLTYYDYAKATASQNVYKTTNGASLGGTVNDAVIYGSKIYIIGSDESTIFVADKNNKLKKITNIKAEVNGEAVKPRHAVADGGFVYVTTYNNAVLAIDTLTYEITDTYACGSYAEGITVNNGILYTADSDYAKGNASISMINLTTKATTTFTHELINNPTDIIFDNGHCYILDNGTYDANWNQSGQGVFELTNDGSVKKLMEATSMAVADGKIYGINAPYSYPATDPTYNVYDIATGKVSTFTDGRDISYPSMISADPVNGNVYITSYQLNNGYADYAIEGYCVIYSADGTYKSKFECGVGGGKVIPNTETQYIQK